LPNAIPPGSLTLAHATAGGSIASHIREHGRLQVLSWIIRELDTVNQITGSGLSEAAVTMCAELIIDRYQYRTPNAFRLALRDGLNSGKIYGKLTYPIIAEWLTEHEERMEAHNYHEHQRTK
jgi:hypothetical protein